MTLEQIMERLIKHGTPEEEANEKATFIIANMDYDKTSIVNEISKEIAKKQQEYDMKERENIRSGGLHNSELEKIQKNIDELYRELDNELGIKPYVPTPVEIEPVETTEEPTPVETEPVEPTEEPTPDVSEKESEENKTDDNQPEKQSRFSDFGMDKMRGMVIPELLIPMVKGRKTETEPIVIETHTDVEDTPLEEIPQEALSTTTEEPKPGLLNRAKNWIKNNKGKAAMIIGAAVVLGIATAAAIHYMVTGDSSAMQNAANVDAGSITAQVANAIDAEMVNQAAKAAQEANQAAANVDTASLTDLLSNTLKQAEGNTIQLATNAYDAVAGNMAPINPSVEVGVPVSAFDIANNAQVPLDALNNMSPEQLQNVSVLMGDTDLAGMLKDVTDPNQINTIISSNISHAQGYTQIPTEIVEQISQGGRVL